MEEIIVGVDTGNRCIKSKNSVFVAGVTVSSTAPIAQNSVIAFNGQYWALTNERLSYMRDKTETDDYFVLTLFAIIKELKVRQIPLRKDSPIPICLGIGLPPTHIAGLKDRYIQYFSRGTVTFRYENQPVSIRITGVKLFAQGYAAAIGLPLDVRRAPHAYIVDIGGYTTDVMALERGVLDPRFCVSLDFGVIGMYNSIQTRIHAFCGHMPTEDMIDELLSGSDNIRLSEEMRKLANDAADEYAARVLRKLAEMGVDLTLNQGIFIGGGSLCLRSRIEKSQYVIQPYFTEDIHANAIGYEAFIRAMNRKKE